MAAMQTFVVRVWVPAEPTDASASGELHGVVEHVATGRSRRFAGADELVSFIENARSADVPDPRS
jgi:hypothetical protein